MASSQPQIAPKDPQEEIKHIAAYGAWSASILLLFETLAFAFHNPWFLWDLGPSNTLRVVFWYGAFWLALAGVLRAVVSSTRMQVRLLASACYFLLSLRVLLHDASVLAQTWGIVGFAVATVAVAVGARVLERWSGSALSWLGVAIGYGGALLSLQYLWSQRGSSVVAFLTSLPAMLSALAWLLIAIVLALALGQRPYQRSVAVFIVAVGLCALAIVSRAGEVRAAGGVNSTSPDIYVFSVDALRKDTFDDWCGTSRSEAAELICRRSSRYDAVITDGISTYQVLTRNLRLEGNCRASLPGWLRKRGYTTSMYLGRKGKRIEGASCLDRYFSGTGRVLLEDFAVPSLFGAWLEPPASALRAKYIGTDEMIGTFAEQELRTTQPVFAYFHALDLHAPYVPRVLAQTPEHLAAVREFMQECYWSSCDLRKPRAAELVRKMRAAYLAGVADVEQHLSQLLSVARSRRRPFTLIMTSDHGELFGEYGGINHSGGFVPELLSVPFAVFRSDQTRTPERDCRLRLSSEALAETLGATTGSLVPGGPRRLAAPPLGTAMIDPHRGVIDYQIAPSRRAYRGTWRNVHLSDRGSQAYPAPCP